MAISTDCDINRALAALGKKGCEWTLSQSIPPHEIIDWRGPGDCPADDEIQAAWDALPDISYIQKRELGDNTHSGYPYVGEQLDQLYHDMTNGKLGVAATTGSWYVGITSVKIAHPKP